ncbi:MAG TPA: hypothetical protein VIL52_04350 [Bacteroidota bacterium]
MKNIRMAMTASVLVLIPVLGIGQDVSEKEEIRRTLKFTGTEAKRIVLDNTDGSITVTGYDGDEIQLVVIKEIEAESRVKIQEAKEEVILEIKEEPNKIILYVDAPWRKSDGSINYRGFHYYGYRVIHDFELRVPMKVSLYLRTVNEGEIIVKDVEGEFEIKNVNAGIEMTNIAGPAKVSTVNGPVKVFFSKNPNSDCSFETVNGRVEVEFQEGLSADLQLKTFNGEVFTDFEILNLPRNDETVERKKGGKKIYRRGDSFSARVGKGGPEFSFNTLNGDIYITKQK